MSSLQRVGRQHVEEKVKAAYANAVEVSESPLIPSCPIPSPRSPDLATWARATACVGGAYGTPVTGPGIPRRLLSPSTWLPSTRRPETNSTAAVNSTRMATSNTATTTRRRLGKNRSNHPQELLTAVFLCES
ncbi:hypothetical protein BRADI_2g45147v3 [Brachypodium distachyon]|uniref:Uncharacterized protein n=1 Tax=Brachypodium distachyon TaxID=15368 RepID=A0A2K2DDW7_BRADI|nr:hypothetical protein BRADI_2g45147v3 [Brachypodium distachyon]PNT72496.1 hypothetical protein BRADI_2g45147v3 [Brachypodium distachyon]